MRPNGETARKHDLEACLVIIVILDTQTIGVNFLVNINEILVGKQCINQYKHSNKEAIRKNFHGIKPFYDTGLL